MRITVEQCPLCGGSAFEPFEKHADPAGELAYVLCPRCGLVLQSPRRSDKALSEFYAEGYRTSVQGTEAATDKDLRIQAGRARHLVEFCSGAVTSVSRHLDIGSSSGALVRAVARAYGSSGLGIEPGAGYREIAKQHGTQTIADLGELDPSLRGTFDLASMIHVLEHLPDPVGYLRQLRERWMAPGGRLLVEVPNLFGHRGTELAHLSVFSPRTLRQTLESAGFRVLKLHAHGAPRSPVLRLYLTALADWPAGSQAVRRMVYSSRGVRGRRRLGIWLHDTLTERLPNWTWRELPAPEEAGS